MHMDHINLNDVNLLEFPKDHEKQMEKKDGSTQTKEYKGGELKALDPSKMSNCSTFRMNLGLKKIFKIIFSWIYLE